MTTELTVEGLNLADANAIHFDRPGIKAKIVRVKELPDLPDIRLGSNGTPSTVDVGPLPPRNQVTVEIDVSPEADIGAVNFRLQTPLGTSPEGRVLIEPFYGESPDREPNNSPENAFETYLPSILVGEISRAGDVDHYKIKVKAGEQLVFENGAMQTGSTLQPVITILREDGEAVGEYGIDGGDTALAFSHKFDQAGTYFVRVGDYQQSGRPSHSYRVKVGSFDLATSAYPLGVRQGAASEVTVSGFGNLGKLTIKGEPEPGEPDILRIRPAGSFSELKLAVGSDPEVAAAGTNTAVAGAQAVTAPVTINGRIDAPGREHYFRIPAKKGEKLVFEVNARRLDSELDSVIDILDSAGKPVEIATVRATLETFATLRDHGSADRNIRLQSISGLNVGDWLMAGGEIMRLQELPEQPDDDTILDNFGGQRLSYFGTSGEAHHAERSVYKVQIHPPATKFTPNGLPLARLYARNDDGGPGYGRDSKFDFTAPADGEYLVRIRDSRGHGSPAHAYRLNVRPPRPDFRLNITPRNPNVPLGGTVALTVTALRLDGYEGPIDIELEGLPQGLTAGKAQVAPGQTSTTLLLSAAADAKLESAAQLKVAGRADKIVRYANPDDKLKLIALAPAPDVVVTAETREVVLEPGSTANISVKIVRNNGFGGRVPIEVRNLPPRVRVPDIGLNGVLINEDETQRTFQVEALDVAEPVEQLIYLSGRVETRAAADPSYAAPQAIVLKVKPRATRAAAR
jgi:hypothetical protein